MHRIRLRGPWTKTHSDLSRVIRTTVPDRPMEEQEHSKSASLISDELFVCYERRFNQPTGLEAGSVVMLTISSWSGQIVDVTLNEKAILISGSPFEVDITEHLASHNRLLVRLASSPTALPCLDGDVAIVILDPANGS